LLLLWLIALSAYGQTYSDQFISYKAIVTPKSSEEIYLLAVYTPLTPEPREYLKGLVSPRLFDLISAKADEYDVSPSLVLEIIRRESGFDPKVCNKKYGCRSGQGLLQIIPSTFAGCEKYFKRNMDVFDAEDNLDCGLHLLSQPSGINHWNPYSGPY
jgi:soluble lytic murein transglycosylase-like protein